MTDLSRSLATYGPVLRSAGGSAADELPVSSPDDPEEREADQIADRIMRSASDSCDCGGTCGHCGDKPAAVAASDTDGEVHRDGVPGTPATGPVPPTPVSPATDVPKPPDQPSQFPPQDQPKTGEERVKDLEDKLGKAGTKALGQGLSLAADEFSKSWLGQRVTDGMERDPVARFFTKTPVGVVSIVALGVGGLAAGLLTEWSARDPGAPGAAPKDEKITSLQFTWGLGGPTEFQLKTPWIDTPKVPAAKPAAAAPLGEPPELMKVTVLGSGICTPTSDGEVGGPDDAAFIYLWLTRNRNGVEKPLPQLRTPPMGPGMGGVLFDRKPGHTGASDPAAVRRGLSSAGAVLDPVDRAFMESRFGTSFGHVRVHSGSEASAAAASVHANAFTVGHDVVFGGGKYEPGSAAGRRLLAHELTHVVHQGHTPVGSSGEAAPFVYRQHTDGQNRSDSRNGVGELPTPQEQRQQAHSVSVMARVGGISKQDVAESERAIAGARLVSKIERREWLGNQRGRRQSRGSGIEWYAGQAAEYGRLHSEIAEQLSALGLPSEAALFELINQQFPDRVLIKAKQIAFAMLAENEAVAKREQERYGKLVCTPDQAGLLDADRRLLWMDRKAEISRLRVQIRRQEAPLKRRGMGIAIIGQPVSMALSAAEQQQRRADELRGVLGIQYPILLMEQYRPGMFVNADPASLYELIQGPAGNVLDNIARVRNAINDDELKVWNIPNAVAMAQLALGVARDPVLTAAIDRRITAIHADEQFWFWVKSALAITTTMLAGFFLSPAVGALLGAAWGVDSLIGNISQYRLEQAASGTSLDPAVADMSLNEPELLWIVLDVVGLGLDLAVITKGIRIAARGVLRNPGPTSLRRLEAATAEAGILETDRRALRSAIAQRFAIAVEETVELVPQTRKIAVSDPQLLAQYERLANQKLQSLLPELMRGAATSNRKELLELLVKFRALMEEVGAAQLSAAQRTAAEAMLRRARTLSAKDWGNVRSAIWSRLGKDPELEALSKRMVANGDAQLGKSGQLRVRTVHDTGKVDFQALEPDHLVRRTDNPWRYSDPSNLKLTDSAQNQQFLEAVRRYGSIWATDDIERFVVGNGLSSQTTTRLPGM